MRPLAQGLLATVALGAVAGTFVVLRRPAHPTSRTVARPTSPLARADALYAAKPKVARNEYEGFVAAHAASPDPKVRDQVGAARMRLGYLAARRHDLPAARSAFLAAAKVKGTGAAGEFGTVDDQAAYQAVVCLVAEGRRGEAREGFEAYLRERPLSALARAAYGRLKRLNGGASAPAWDALMQAAVARQEARVRFETSVCGPKCLERVLSNSSSWGGAGVGSPKPPDYKALAKLCGTTDAGTTVQGMRKGLKALGRESWAARLNRQDLAKARLPAILLQGDHYVVLESLEGDRATVWDPRFGSSKPWPLPNADDPDFAATALLLAKPEGL